MQLIIINNVIIIKMKTKTYIYNNKNNKKTFR